MSVPEGARGEGRFTLPVKANELAQYTLKITKNEKIFLPNQDRLIGMLVDNAVGAYLLICEANGIRVKDDEKINRKAFLERQELQDQAIKKLKNLLALIDLARKVFHLSSKRVKYWGSMVIEVRNRTQSWKEDDMRRYSRK